MYIEPMTIRFIALSCFVCVGTLPVYAQPAPPAVPVTKVVKEVLADAGAPVVVELFTSRSCPFCPAADKIIAELSQRPGVIGITCPVDYFTMAEKGKTDACTARQGWYMDRFRTGPGFTPQLVVNGTRTGAGNRTDTVNMLVAQAKAEGTEAVIIDAMQKPDVYRIALPEGLTQKGLAGWVLNVATFGKGTAMQNKVAGKLQSIPLDTFKGREFQLTVPLPAQDGFAVFVQKQDSGQIAAAGQFVKAPLNAQRPSLDPSPLPLPAAR
jgi:hypothetical protein